MQKSSQKGNVLSQHKFPRALADGDEIHPLRQIRHINLLVFSGEAARLDGLAHEVGDSECGILNSE